MIDRRNFLRFTGVAAATLAAGDLLGCVHRASTMATGTGALDASTGAPRFPVTDVGLQLYTVRGDLARDVERTLQQVADAGYRLVETAGLANRTPSEFRAALDRHGLRSLSGHWSLQEVDDTDDMIAKARTLGQQYVVIPSLPRNLTSSMDGWREAAERLNRLGEKLQAAGLQLGYHNHTPEFQTFGGSTPAYDTLISRTDPKLVTFEMDIFWIHEAGYDPLVYFDRYPGRFQLAHLKDSKGGHGGDAMARLTPVGSGVIDWRRILAAADRAGLRYAFVEQDVAADPIAAIRASHAYLERLLPAA